MDIEYKGANCLKISTKKATLVVDDNLSKVGSKSVPNADIRLYTHESLKGDAKDKETAFVIDGPGEYEISAISVIGISAQAHMDEADKKTATIYKVIASGVSTVVLGHIYPDLSDDQLEKIGLIDVLVIPVGGNGYTLDAVGASKVIKKIEPKIIIPTHYNQKGISYEVPQGELEDFAKEVGLEINEEEKLKLKRGTFPENVTLYKLKVS